MVRARQLLPDDAGLPLRGGDGPSRRRARAHHAAVPAALQPAFHRGFRYRGARAHLRHHPGVVLRQRRVRARDSVQKRRHHQSHAGRVHHGDREAPADARQIALHLQPARRLEGHRGHDPAEGCRAGHRFGRRRRALPSVGAREHARVLRPARVGRGPLVVPGVRLRAHDDALRRGLQRALRAPRRGRRRVGGRRGAEALHVRGLARGRGAGRRGRDTVCTTSSRTCPRWWRGSKSTWWTTTA